jgi:hypothetical protein
MPTPGERERNERLATTDLLADEAAAMTREELLRANDDVPLILPESQLAERGV